MFTKNVPTISRRSRLLGLLAGPHGVDRFTELVDPMWTSDERATVVRVGRSTPGSVTLWLRPNHPLTGLRAGQYLTVTVEIDGRRHTRCYSPAGAEGAGLIELTVARHDGGTVSRHLHACARPGMTVGLSGPAGDFVLPTPRPRRLLLIAGGSGITPIAAMARTLHGEGSGGEVTAIHYVRTLEDACYRAELAAIPGLRVLYGATRGPGGDLEGRFGAAHLAAAMPDPDAVYVCGPPALVDAVRQLRPDAVAESFAPAPAVIPDTPGGGRITFSHSGVDTDDDGQTLLEQAESAGLAPQSGCRMGICHTCTRRKVHGVVRNLSTGALSTDDDDAVQICVSVPVGDVDIDL
ncbi:MAG: ferredoxin reductase [Mycobacterium sp.]